MAKKGIIGMWEMVIWLDNDFLRHVQNIGANNLCLFHIIILRNNERKRISRQHHQKFYSEILYCTLYTQLYISSLRARCVISLPILWNQLKQYGIHSFHLNVDVCYVRSHAFEYENKEFHICWLFITRRPSTDHLMIYVVK